MSACLFEFSRGDRIEVVHVRPHLHHDIGETAIVLRGNYRGEDPLIDIQWETGSKIKTTVYANQFVLTKKPPPDCTVLEDTREYLSIITGETHA